MEAIIVSGLPAVGKTTVAKIIAKKLRLRTLGGGDILKEIASERGVETSGKDWWDTEEGMKFLAERKKSQEFDKEVDRRLLKRVDGGDVVITSYTIPWLAKKGVKVWLAGSVESRARRMARRDRMGVEECRKIIAFRDRENHEIYKKLYRIEFGRDLSPFDLVIGTDGLSAARVGGEVLKHIRGRK